MTPKATLGAPAASSAMVLSPQFLLTRARRYRHLASKSRAMVAHEQDDIAAPRLIELAEQLEADAATDEREAQALLGNAESGQSKI